MLRAALTIVGLSVLGLRAQAFESDVLMRADLAANTTNDARQEGTLQKGEIALQWNGALRFSDAWRAVANVRVRFDAEDRLEPGEPDQEERSHYNRRWLLGDEGDAELRELYADGGVGPVNFRIGKQQIAWGQADGLRVLDVVNPMSYREFILPKPEDRRIALWTLNTEIAFDAGSLQLLWLPDPTYDELPLGDEMFAITSPKLVPQIPSGVPVDVRATQRPHGLFDASDVGGRLSLFAGGWDLTLNYLYHYYDNPVPFSALTPGGIVTTPRYERSRLIGGSASNAFGSTTLRCEVAYSTDRWFLTTDRTDLDQVFASDEVAVVMGVDNTTFNDTLLSVQYFHSHLREPVRGATRDRNERQVTLLVQRSFVNETFKLRTLWLTSLNQRDGAVQAQLSWQASTSIAIALGIEKFYGDREGIFGEFRDASRAGISFEWMP